MAASIQNAPYRSQTDGDRREKFFIWLASKVSATQLSELYDNHHRIDQFCLTRKLLAKPLFQIDDMRTVQKLISELKKSLSFRIQKNSGLLFAILDNYMHYLRELDEEKKNNLDPLVQALRRDGFETIDRRGINGCLWVIAGRDKAPYFSEWNLRSIFFSFEPNGSTATGNRPAWWTRARVSALPQIQHIKEEKIQEKEMLQPVLPSVPVNQEEQQEKEATQELLEEPSLEKESESAEQSEIRQETFIQDAEESLLQSIASRGFEYIDNRRKDGCLWVICGREQSSFFHKWQEKGVHFYFSPGGRKATKYRPAWWTKDVMENETIHPAEAEKSLDQPQTEEPDLPDNVLEENIETEQQPKEEHHQQALNPVAIGIEERTDINSDQTVDEETVIQEGFPPSQQESDNIQPESSDITPDLNASLQAKEEKTGNARSPEASSSLEESSKKLVQPVQKQDILPETISPELWDFLSDAKYDPLRDVLEKQKIWTMDQFVRQDLWILLNAYHLYPMERRKEIYRDIHERLKKEGRQQAESAKDQESISDLPITEKVSDDETASQAQDSPAPEVPLSIPEQKEPVSSSVQEKDIRWAETIVFSAKRKGISIQELSRGLLRSVEETERIVQAAPHLISLPDRLIHEDALTGWEDAKIQLKSIWKDLLIKNKGKVSPVLLYLHVFSSMAAFLQENKINSKEAVYAIVQHFWPVMEIVPENIHRESENAVSENSAPVQAEAKVQEEQLSETPQKEEYSPKEETPEKSADESQTIDNASPDKTPPASRTWKIVDDTTAIHTCDSSFVKYNGTDIPRHMYRFFDMEKIRPMGVKRLIIVYQGQKYNATIIKDYDTENRDQIFWQPALGKKLKAFTDGRPVKAVFKKIGKDEYELSVTLADSVSTPTTEEDQKNPQAVLPEISEDQYDQPLGKYSSWEIVDANMAVKTCDKTFFQRNESVVPNGILSFFDAKTLQPGETRKIRLLYQANSYDALLARDMYNGRVFIYWGSGTLFARSKNRFANLPSVKAVFHKCAGKDEYEVEIVAEQSGAVEPVSQQPNSTAVKDDFTHTCENGNIPSIHSDRQKTADTVLPASESTPKTSQEKNASRVLTTLDNEQLFFKWMREKATPERITVLYQCSSRLNAFCYADKQCRSSLFAIRDTKALSALLQKLEQDKRFLAESRSSQMLSLLRYYITYLFEQSTGNHRFLPSAEPERKDDTAIEETQPIATSRIPIPPKQPPVSPHQTIPTSKDALTEWEKQTRDAFYDWLKKKEDSMSKAMGSFICMRTLNKLAQQNPTYRNSLYSIQTLEEFQVAQSILGRDQAFMKEIQKCRRDGYDVFTKFLVFFPSYLRSLQQEKESPPSQPVPAPSPVQKEAPKPEPVPQPVQTVTDDRAKTLASQMEAAVLKNDLAGMTVEDLAEVLHEPKSSIQKAIQESSRLVWIENRCIHEEAFVDWSHGADQLEAILEKLLDKNNGYVSAAQLYEYARIEMQMFLNDNDMDDARRVYDLSEHLFSKVGYHGKRYSFWMKNHISRQDAAVSSTLDVIQNYAREHDGRFREEEIVEYLLSVKLKTGNLRGIMKVYEKPIFFFYDDHAYITAESMGMDRGWFDTVKRALDQLFADMGDHVVIRDIQPWWFSLLPPLPGGMAWTALLLQSVLRFYSGDLGARTIYGLDGQTGDTLHAMLVSAKSEVQTFGDAVLSVLLEDGVKQRQFEAEELRQLLVRRGLIAGNELIWNMPKALPPDERFVWDASQENVTIKV